MLELQLPGRLNHCILQGRQRIYILHIIAQCLIKGINGFCKSCGRIFRTVSCVEFRESLLGITYLTKHDCVAVPCSECRAVRKILRYTRPAVVYCFCVFLVVVGVLKFCPADSFLLGLFCSEVSLVCEWFLCESRSFIRLVVIPCRS